MSTKWSSLTQNLGKEGPDEGEVLLEDELAGIARITVEKKLHQVSHDEIFAVTVVIFNKLVNTFDYLTYWIRVVQG